MLRNHHPAGILAAAAAALLAATSPVLARLQAGPPGDDRAAADAAAPLRADDFEGDGLAAFWLPGDHGSGRYAPGAVRLSARHARAGRRSVEITLRSGDVAQRGDSGQATERAELDSGKHQAVGRELFYGFSVLIPPDFPVVNTRLVIAQLKQVGVAGSPIIAQRFRAGVHYLTIRDTRAAGGAHRYFALPPLEPGTWHDMVYRVRWAADDGGRVEVWMNGERVVKYAGPTAVADGDPRVYHKIGLYRDRWPDPMTIYFDCYAIGERFAAVEPATQRRARDERRPRRRVGKRSFLSDRVRGGSWRCQQAPAGPVGKRSSTFQPPTVSTQRVTVALLQVAPASLRRIRTGV